MIKTAEMRIAARWFPTDAEKIEHPLGCCYVQTITKTVRGADTLVFTVIAFAGSAAKNSFYESYRRAEDRDKRVAEFFAGLERNQAYKAERKAERSKPHDLTMGDVIYNSWGYDQTNVDFYQVTKTTDHFVWLQPIACETTPGEGISPMAGYCQPVLPIRQILTRETREWGDYDEVSGTRPSKLVTVPVKAKQQRAEGRSVRFEFGCGTVWDGRPKYESWYA